MSSRIWGLYPTRDQFIPINLFGYTTKGIPGLEVVGLKSYSRSIKEKFIYLTRQQQDQIPLRRYVICTESSGQLLLDEQNYRWLELPMLILFWSLAGYLPIQRLDDCLSLGRVSVTGEIESRDISQTLVGEFNFIKPTNMISPSDKIVPNHMNLLPLEEIFKDRIGLTFL